MNSEKSVKQAKAQPNKKTAESAENMLPWNVFWKTNETKNGPLIRTRLQLKTDYGTNGAWTGFQTSLKIRSST